MKKLIQNLTQFRVATILSVLLLNSSNSFSQSYYHGIGGQGALGFYQLEYTSPNTNFTGNYMLQTPCIFYKATLGFSDHFALSAYPFLGFTLSASSRGGGSGSIGLGLPVNLELYFGDMEEGCFFMGGGFSYAVLASSYTGNGNVIGPQFALGGQFYLRDRLYGVRLGYTIGMNKAKVDIPDVVIHRDKKSLLTVGVYYPIGQ